MFELTRDLSSRREDARVAKYRMGKELDVFRVESEGRTFKIGSDDGLLRNLESFVTELQNYHTLSGDRVLYTITKYGNGFSLILNGKTVLRDFGGVSNYALRNAMKMAGDLTKTWSFFARLGIKVQVVGFDSLSGYQFEIAGSQSSFFTRMNPLQESYQKTNLAEYFELNAKKVLVEFRIDKIGNPVLVAQRQDTFAKPTQILLDQIPVKKMEAKFLQQEIEKGLKMNKWRRWAREHPMLTPILITAGSGGLLLMGQQAITFFQQ